LTIVHPIFSGLQLATLLHEDSGIAVSRCTINRARHLAHFSYLPPKRVSGLDRATATATHAVCHRFSYRETSVGEVDFCDESRFTMGPDNHWVWRRRGEYTEGVFAEPNKYTKISIHVWAVIGSGFKFPFIIFAKSVDLIHYINFSSKKWIL
jgi:hypothetical protein